MTDVFVGDNDHGDPVPSSEVLLHLQPFLMIKQLRKELETLHQRIKDIKEGFEGCCNACEPVGEMNKQLREERDEARRLYCQALWLQGGVNPAEQARIKDWDCFPDKTEADANNTLFRTTDGE